jgi:putative ABC transport system permease protein
VSAAAYGTDNLMPGYLHTGLSLELADGTQVPVKVDYLSANFLETSGLRLVRGHLPPQGGGDVMINESFARVRFGKTDPLGQALKPLDGKGGGVWTVVGVVADMRETVRDAPGYHVYAPETWWPPNMTTFIVRTTGAADAAMASALKRAVYAFDPKIVPLSATPLAQLRGWQNHFESFTLSVLRVLAAIALVLTVVGVFSVLVYTVDRRMGEFGVRLALGATARNLAGLVMRRGLALVSLGVLAGLAGALALTRYVQSLLFETAPYDPVVLGVVALVLLVASALACLWPSRLAAKADVPRLLRSE